jgi:hypothetical protein
MQNTVIMSTTDTGILLDESFEFWMPLAKMVFKPNNDMLGMAKSRLNLRVDSIRRFRESPFFAIIRYNM